MEIRARHLIVVPTGGCVRERDQLLPNHLGNYRLTTAAKILFTDPTALLAISGGERENPAESEAVVHYLAFIYQWPEFADRVVIVDASSIYTAGDMAALAPCIEGWEREHPEEGRFSRITIASELRHARNAIRSLNAGFQRTGDRNFSIAESGEPPGRPSWQQAFIDFVTRWDPFWETWLSWPLRFVAARDKRHV